MDKFLGLKQAKFTTQTIQDQPADRQKDNLWVEKYRPKSLEDVVFQEHAINALKKTRETGKMQHLLFYGPPGTGKTSTILAVS